MDTEIVKHLDVPEIFRIKLKFLDQLKQFQKLDEDIGNTTGILASYSPTPYRLQWNYDNYFDDKEIKYIDRLCWRYLTQLFELEKYMLCTDHEKMTKEIEEFKVPEFTVENAEGWLAGLKELIYNNIATLIKSVFTSITNETYYTGSGYSNRKKKKRNNNGIDKNFILTTNDYDRMFNYGWGWGHNKPSLTDDLEKVCYIMDGKTVPKLTMKQMMVQEKKLEGINDYFKIKVCQNGNTHYTLFDASRNKLNLYGAGKGIIGEDIKIKIFEKGW